MTNDIVGATIVRWEPGSTSDGPLAQLLEEARSSDAVWDPECEVAYDAVRERTPIPAGFQLELYMALNHAKPCAFGLLKRFASEAWIIEVYVIAKHRRRGTASRMFNHLVSEAARQGLSRVLIEFEGFRTWSRGLALNAGFQHAGTLNYPGSTETVEYWIRGRSA